MPGHFGVPEDFIVEEIPLYEPSGEGGHTFLWVEKRLRNTDEVAKLLARAAGVSERDVGYAGRKDRHAVTRQSFSVPGFDPEAALAVQIPGVSILRAVAHGHKLRTGQLAGNRFQLRVRGIDDATRERVEREQPSLRGRGLPNRFGRQRFGRDGSNAERGRRILAGESSGVDRRRARFLVSALQATVFNDVLAARPLAIDRVEVGDVARRTDSGGLFLVEDGAVENERAAHFEISATGPIFGSRMESPEGAVAARERAVFERFGIDLTVRLPGVRLRGGRRPVRVPISSFTVEFVEDDLRLGFELPAGSFATVLLEELLGYAPESRRGE